MKPLTRMAIADAIDDTTGPLAADRVLATLHMHGRWMCVDDDSDDISMLLFRYGPRAQRRVLVLELEDEDA